MANVDYIKLLQDSRRKRLAPAVQQTNFIPLVEEREENRGGGLSSFINKTVGLLGNLDRPRGFTAGFLKGGLDDAITGFKDPGSVSGRDILGINRVSDRDFIGNLSLRDILGGVADVATDPLTFAIPFGGGALSNQLRRAGIRGLPMLVEPIVGGTGVSGKLKQVGAEFAAGLGARSGSQLAIELAPEKFANVAGLAGGLFGGVSAANLAGARTNPFRPQIDVSKVSQNPFEDVIRFEVENVPFQTEGQLVRADALTPSFSDIDTKRVSVTNEIKFLEEDIVIATKNRKSFVPGFIKRDDGTMQQLNERLTEAKSTLDNLEDTFAREQPQRELINQRNQLVLENQSPQFGEGTIGLKATQLQQEWIGSSSSSTLRKNFDKLSEFKTIEEAVANDLHTIDELENLLEPFDIDVLISMRKMGEPLRAAIRREDPYYNAQTDTTLLYRGENIGTLRPGNTFVTTGKREPQIAQSYTTDPAVAGLFGRNRGEWIIAREVPVEDIYVATPGHLSESEIIVINSGKFTDDIYETLSDGRPKTGAQLQAVREKPFLPNDADTSVGARLGFAESTGAGDIPDDLKFFPSNKAQDAINAQQVNFITIRDDKGRIVSTQRVDELALKSPRGIVKSTTGKVTGSNQPSLRRLESLSGREQENFGDLQINRRLQEELDVKARFEAQQANVEFAHIDGGTAEVIGGETGKDFVVSLDFNPEKVNVAPQRIVAAMLSRTEQLKLMLKADVKTVADNYGIPTKGLSKPNLIALVVEQEYRGRFQQISANIGTPTGTPRTVRSSISTDMPKLLAERTADSYFESVINGKLPPIVQRAVDDIAREAKGVDSGVINVVNQSLKLMWATLDMSFIGIQGLFNLGIWASTGRFDKIADFTRVAFQSIGSEEAFNNYANLKQRESIKMGAPRIEEIIGSGAKERYGTSLHLATFEGIADIGRVNKGITDVPLLGNLIERANRSWSASGDYARLDTFYDNWARHGGKNLTDIEIGQIMNATNRMTGISSANRLGPAGNIALFAPRFLQSQIEQVVRYFDVSTIEGSMARRSINRLVGTGVFLTVMANELNASRKEDYEPFTNTDFRLMIDGRPNSNFMRIKNVLGTDISVFGPWDTLVRSIAAVGFSDDRKQALLDVGRSKSGPLLSLGINLATGQTFLGEEFNTPGTILKETLLPFAWRDIGNEPLSSVAFGFFGVKATPLTANEQMELKMRNAGRDFDDPLDRRQWLVEHPEDKPKARTGEGKASELVRGDIERRHQFNEILTFQGEQTLVEYVDNRRVLQTELRNRLDTIFGDTLKRPPRNKQERWIQEYFNLFDAAKDLNDPTGGINGFAFDQMLSAWVEEQGQEALDYVNQFNLVGNLELENQYISAIRELDKLGFFSMAKLNNMRSDLSENSILGLHQQVLVKRISNPRLQAVEFSTAAWQVLREQGYSGLVIRDVINSGKDRFQNPALVKLRQTRPDLTIWFNPNATYANLQQLQQQQQGGTQTINPYALAAAR